MPNKRAYVLKQEPLTVARERVIHFRRPHRVRQRVSG